jgi:hypothetical protein
MGALSETQFMSAIEYTREAHEGIAAYTIDEFCHAHRMGRATLYELWKRGIGPRYFLVGSHRRISVEAAAAYRAAREAAACGPSD